MIPKIMHQVWLGNKQIPIHFLKWKLNWDRLHPDWCYHLWTDEDIKKIKDKKLNFLLDECHKFSSKSNVFRLYIILNYGGVYFDMDFDWNKNIDEFLSHKSIACQETPGVYCNAFFGAEKNNEWVKFQWDNLDSHVKLPAPWGPRLMTFAASKVSNNLETLPTKLFYPYLWHHSFKETSSFPESYGVHHWSKSWQEKEKFNFSYILPYRQTTEKRKNNLKTILNFLDKNSKNNFEIILVEQDDTTKIDFSLPKNCKHIFAVNKSHFNRSWAFNIGAKISLSETLVFADCDLFFDFNEFLECCKLCKKQYDAIDPKGENKVLALSSEGNIEKHETFYVRKGVSFAGGICLINKSKFFDIGGWDEDFVGWGAEDDVMSYKIKKTLSNFVSLGLKIFHLYHENAFFTKNINAYNNNVKILKKVRLMDKQQIIEYYRDREIGNVNKYKKCLHCYPST